MAARSTWQRAGRALLSAAAVALLVALALIVKDRRLLLSGAHAHGDVVKVDTKAELATTTYAPVVRFFVDGTAYVFTARASTLPYSVGDGVEVLYDPRNPQRASADETLSLWLPALTALAAAVVLGGIGGVLVLTRD
jgi:hypothetical protein